MKNIIIKFFSIIAIVISIVSCQSISSSGKWEAVQKSDDTNTTVTTTLNINESFDEFSASMSMKIDGNKDNLLADKTDIKFSGYISGKILVISKVDNVPNSILKGSTLTISEDGKYLTLSPKGVIFKKK